MKCSYCNEEMKLQRWVKEEWNEGDRRISERFCYECNKCMIILSPKLVLLDNAETEAEKQVMRDLFFKLNPPQSKNA